MQLGLIISVLMHVAILGGALISIQSRAELRLPETEPVAVGMISPGDVTKVKQGLRTAKLLEAEPRESHKGEQARKEAKQPPKTAAAAPPPPTSAPPPAPKEPDPPSAAAEAEAQRKAAEAQRKLQAEQQKQSEAQRLAEQKKQAEEQAKAEALQRAEAQKVAEEKRRIEEEQKQAEARKRAEEEQKRLEEQRKQAEMKKKREEERKRRQAALKKKRDAEKKRREDERKRQEAEAAAKAKQFNADKIAALLNKVPDKAPPPPSAADQPTKAKGPTLGAADERDNIISASEKALIGRVIKSCVTPRWTVLSGGASAQETVVKIRLRFNKDGTLSAPPQITNPQGTPYFRAISESALRAVRECEPYSLPRSLYEHWKDTIINFSPTDMF